MGMREMQPVKKAKKGILNLIFSRAVILVVLVIVQLFIFAATVTFLQDYATYIHTAFLILSVVIVIHIINSKSNPSFKITWMLLILISPILGTAFYGFMKMQIGTAFLEKRLVDLSKSIKPYMLQD